MTAFIAIAVTWLAASFVFGCLLGKHFRKMRDDSEREDANRREALK